MHTPHALVHPVAHVKFFSKSRYYNNIPRNYCDTENMKSPYSRFISFRLFVRMFVSFSDYFRVGTNEQLSFRIASNINKSISIKYIGIICVCTKIKDPGKRSTDNNIIKRKETGTHKKNNNISTFRKDLQTTPWFSSLAAGAAVEKLFAE